MNDCAIPKKYAILTYDLKFRVTYRILREQYFDYWGKE